ncbi:hypothetical protein D8674_016577 [Pyrus ussuriensis x Pyrus communis]|uniref:Uncharacterized protein n=1 Tax=Pyrus ussuriensis x Pyrus communis TaxID=2448454 RepID=A0A5N5HDC9_9ROSA|nr:hypothetical protein D8674_016577 [Pyrus ussuriensis x Pyrus communis]
MTNSYAIERSSMQSEPATGESTTWPGSKSKLKTKKLHEDENPSFYISQKLFLQSRL